MVMRANTTIAWLKTWEALRKDAPPPPATQKIMIACFPGTSRPQILATENGTFSEVRLSNKLLAPWHRPTNGSLASRAREALDRARTHARMWWGTAGDGDQQSLAYVAYRCAVYSRGVPSLVWLSHSYPQVINPSHS